MDIYPSIDLRAGKVVRLLQGDYDRQTTYDLDPLELARTYRQAGATWLHVVDLDGARGGEPVQLDRVGQLARHSGLKVQAGGGVRNTEHVVGLLAAGVSRVVVGTAALEDWDWFDDLLRDPRFAGNITLALDAKDGIVATRGWTASSGKSATQLAERVRGKPLAGILYTDVAVDGTLAGPSVDRTAEMVRATDIPIIASGGVGNLGHIRELLRTGCAAAIVGRSLYERTLDLASAIELARRRA